jgi:ribosomal protein S18 acetylase RimI-like enzyme
MQPTTLPAAESDIAFARETHHLAYRDVVVRQFGQWDERAQDRFFENGWDSAEHAILLADGEPCGYAAIEERVDDTHVRELVIHPDHQEEGIGTSFLRQVQERARTLGVPVRLGTHLENRAQVLYKRLGFREFDRTETHILMEWEG